jgi:transcriptional regulator GlxA family with amidase domain
MDEISRLIEDVGAALRADFRNATKSAARLAALLAAKLAENHPLAPARGGLAPWQQRKIQRSIEEGLEGTLPVDALAKLVSLSPSYFCRAFKASFGTTPHAYIIARRVERARTMMLTTSDSLSQIALACGLADQAHLCHCFRRITGMSPAAWRRSFAPERLSSGHMTAYGETRGFAGSGI